MSMLTDIPFTLPRGYVDASGLVHRPGRMRLATALDEIEAYQDPHVQANEAYLPVVLFSRVVVQDLYQRINSPGRVTLGVVCPQCGSQFQIQVAPLDADETIST
jgi:hypothetical protein